MGGLSVSDDEIMNSICGYESGIIRLDNIYFGSRMPRLFFTGSVNNGLAFNIVEGSFFHNRVIENNGQIVPYELAFGELLRKRVDDYAEENDYFGILKDAAITPVSKALIGVYSNIAGRQR